MKKSLFSKFKDYNYILDKVLEEKRFSEDAKNLLLNMIYKIENSYKDYAQIKGIFETKTDFIDGIIDNVSKYCKYLFLVDPKKEEVKMLKEQNVLALTNEKEKRIYAYPTELAILYGVIEIKPKYFYIARNYYYLKEQLQALLVEGTILNDTEVIRNFNGWSWNLAEDANINHVANMIYQAIRILIDEDFLKEWEQNTSSKIDYIYEMRKELLEYYGKECSREFYIAMARLVVASSLKKNRKKVKEEYDKVAFAYNSMKNKTEYIYRVSEEKKKITVEIEAKDKLLNDSKGLIQEFNKRNSNLPDDMKIFNVSALVDILQSERQKCIKRIKELNELVKPLNYSQLKNELAEKLSILSVVTENKDIRKYSIDFQEAALKCFYENLNKISNKEEIIDIIYKMRYYRKIRVTENEKIEDITVLYDYVKKILKTLVTIACKERTFNIFCKDIEFNYQIIEKALNTSIANYEDIDISLKIDGEMLQIYVYDNEILDRQVEIKYPLTDKDLSIKQGKRIPMYVM